MCLAVPFKVDSVKDNEAMVSRDGIARLVRVDLVNPVRKGDYVLVHAGFAIEKVDEKTALENLEAQRELQTALEEIKREMEEGR